MKVFLMKLYFIKSDLIQYQLHQALYLRNITQRTLHDYKDPIRDF